MACRRLQEVVLGMGEPQMPKSVELQREKGNRVAPPVRWGSRRRKSESWVRLSAMWSASYLRRCI